MVWFPDWRSVLLSCPPQNSHNSHGLVCIAFGTFLSSQLFSKLCDMSNKIVENLVVYVAYGLHWCGLLSRPLIGISSSILQDLICLVCGLLH